MPTQTRKHDTEAAFNEAYASLNAAQRQAVDTIEGPVMVIAGPGTGKTQILTLRIANILKSTDTKPENILALTFTEAGAVAMRDRLRRYIGATAYQVPIHTFHGFAGSLIKQYPDAYATIIGGRPIRDLERISVLESILDSAEIKSLRPAGNPEFYLQPLLHALQTLKREAISPDNLATHTASLEALLQGTEQYHTKGAHKGKERGEYTALKKKITKNSELGFVYRAYEAALRKRRVYDFDDMLIETIKALRTDESMLRDLQETHQYLLADEHQDVNGSQNQILELLADFHESPNIFVVGDEKQAIYRFQGASLENFLYFEDRFKGATTISLTENYRSSQNILDIAHELIAVEKDSPLHELRVPLSADTKEVGMMALRTFSHQAVEDDFVVDAVEKQLAAGVPAHEIAVIVRRNSEVEAMADHLRRHEIPVTATAEGDILSHPITAAVQCLLQVLARPEDERALVELLHAPYAGISLSELATILSVRSHSDSLWSAAANTPLIVSLERIKQETASDPAHRIVARLINETGLKDFYVGHHPHEAGRVLRRLLDEIEAMVTEEPSLSLREVSERFVAYRTHHLPLTAPYIASAAASVQVMTAHKAKGLEFEVVVAPHLIDSAWGGRKSPEYFSLPLTEHVDQMPLVSEDDEKRLLYVLLTRAKRTLLLSCSSANLEGKELLPSRLLSQIDSLDQYTETVEAFEAAFDPLSGVRTCSPPASLSPELLTTLFSQRGFSATSLNNYLKSPYTYLYRNIFRIPEVQTLPLLFGTAIHDSLEELTRTHTATGELPPIGAISALLSTRLERLPLSPTEYSQLHERGVETLTIYHEHLATTLPQKTIEELSIKVMLPSGLLDCPEIPLSGKLDRLDFDEGGRVLRVVDYKTGAPKTRNVIEGNTKTSDGGYKRQLVFYALLLSLYDDERYLTRNGVLSFVEADKHGVIHDESFTITEDEIEALKQEIITAAKSFTSGEFLAQTCDPATSDYCDLFALLLGKE